MAKPGKNYRTSRLQVDRQTRLSLDEAISTVKDAAFAKFDETIDLAVNLGVNPKYADQMVRGACILPNGTGKDATVLVFARGEKQIEAREAGADYVGLEDLIEKIQNEGFLEFDKTVATPDVMGMVGKLGRILGRRGLMPNPKVGTVTFDIAKAVKEAKGGKIEFRVDKNGIIHASVGRKSFEAGKIRENILALIETLLRMRPASSKGTYLKRMTVSSTMGPGIKVDTSDVISALR
jgi:large subunit ribosomal protein L1